METSKSEVYKNRDLVYAKLSDLRDFLASKSIKSKMGRTKNKVPKLIIGGGEMNVVFFHTSESFKIFSNGAGKGNGRTFKTMDDLFEFIQKHVK